MEYDYTYDVIEKILIKRSITDKIYLSRMADIYNLTPKNVVGQKSPMRWFEKNKPHAIILQIAIMFYKKYNTTPNNATLKLLIDKYCEKYDTFDQQTLQSALIELNSLNIDIYSEISELNMENFKDEKIFYYTICDSVDTVSKHGNIDTCIENLRKAQKITFKDDNFGTIYFNKECMDKHWEYIMNPEAKVSTGWKALDRFTNGGFLKDGRMLAVFLGQAGLGKSLFLANIATNLVAQNKSVVVISLEMSENVYATRFDAIISNDNINGLKYSSVESRKKIENFYSLHPDANLIIKEYPPSTVKPIDIERYLEKLVEKGIKIDAIVIDYLNLMVPNTKSDNMYESIKKIVEQLRAMSYKFNAPVISATQTNRSGMNQEKVGLENVSESTGTSATADFIMAIYRSEDDIQNGVINGRIIKNRFGPPGGLIPFHMDPKSLKLTDMASGQDEETKSEADVISNNLKNISSDFDDL